MDFKTFYEKLLPIEKPLLDYYKEILTAVKPEAILEVGSGWGLFTRAVIEHLPATTKHITIDKTGGYGLPIFQRNTGGFEDRFTRLESDSHILLPQKEAEWKGKFNFVFVDGDHTQDGACKDIEQAWQMVAPGGWMMIDDVFHKCNWEPDTIPDKFNFGVTIAVWSFLQVWHKEFLSYPQIIPVAHGIVVVQKK